MRRVIDALTAMLRANNQAECESTPGVTEEFEGGRRCLWRNIITASADSDDATCTIVADEMRCVLGEFQGAGCGGSCMGPVYGRIYGRVLPDGTVEVASSCEFMVSGSFQFCGSPDVPSCPCGCELECTQEWC